MQPRVFERALARAERELPPDVAAALRCISRRRRRSGRDAVSAEEELLVRLLEPAFFGNRAAIERVSIAARVVLIGA